MKKMLLIASAACLTMSSCVKDYKCECVNEFGEIGSATEKTTMTTTVHARKSTAESVCKLNEYNYTSGTYIDKTECSIK